MTAGMVLAACSAGEQVTGGPAGTYLVPRGIHKIKHVIIVMQENRSFDSYFGTYPGADGIPMTHGVPWVCVPDPAGGCSRPYHDQADRNGGGPHSKVNAVADVSGGSMNGFIQQRDAAKSTCHVLGDPACQRDAVPGLPVAQPAAPSARRTGSYSVKAEMKVSAGASSRSGTTPGRTR